MKYFDEMTLAYVKAELVGHYATLLDDEDGDLLFVDPNEVLTQFSPFVSAGAAIMELRNAFEGLRSKEGRGKCGEECNACVAERLASKGPVN